MFSFLPCEGMLDLLRSKGFPTVFFPNFKPVKFLSFKEDFVTATETFLKGKLVWPCSFSIASSSFIVFSQIQFERLTKVS